MTTGIWVLADQLLIGKFCYLPELLPTPLGLIAEFFPNGTGLNKEYSSSELVSKYI
jgi:hypothetical protein